VGDMHVDGLQIIPKYCRDTKLWPIHRCIIIMSLVSSSQGIANNNNNNKGCVTHYGLAIYIKKYLKAKEEELWKLKYFNMKKYNLHKKSSE
jgi:hypothetical protein